MANLHKITIYLTYTLRIMAVILQTRCFQMDNCEPDLSFSKYVELDCFRWLYTYGHICDFLSRYAQLKEYILLQSEAWGLASNGRQATGLDAWASRVKCPARFVSHLHEICIYI